MSDKIERQYVVCYTDGSCNSKNKLGGIGVYIEFMCGEELISVTRISAGYKRTTVSRMELIAIETALDNVFEKDNYPIVVVSDSMYAVNVLNKWMYYWERDGWGDKANLDIIKRLKSKIKSFSCGVKFIHTRGHGRGKEKFIEGNDEADRLADYKHFDHYTEDISI